MNTSKTQKYILLFYITIMCIQYIPIEGVGISDFKFGAMILCPLIWFLNFKTFSKSFVVCLLYIIAISFSSLYNFESFRLSSYGYKLAFVVMFLMAYDIVYIRKALNIIDFENFVKKLIFAFVIVLVLQQIAIIVGIRKLPIINLLGYLNRGIGANSLTVEPSHTARILTVLALVYLRTQEIKFGKKLDIKKAFRYNKKIFIGFLWSMITMGSGTAFVGLAILATYFINTKNLIKISFIFVLIYTIAININYEPLDRAIASIESVTTFDNEQIKEADGSAAIRILPVLNTFSELELSYSQTWFGYGIDSNDSTELLGERRTVGDLKDYGLITYILSLILVFSLAIRKFYCVETLIFVLLLGAGINNISYIWGILLIFTTMRYFQLNQKNS